MSPSDTTVINALSLAGSTFAFGMIFGWVLSVLIFGGSSGSSGRRDDEE
jgi:hypothetical protein